MKEGKREKGKEGKAILASHGDMEASLQMSHSPLFSFCSSSKSAFVIFLLCKTTLSHSNETELGVSLSWKTFDDDGFEKKSFRCVQSPHNESKGNLYEIEHSTSNPQRDSGEVYEMGKKNGSRKKGSLRNRGSEQRRKVDEENSFFLEREKKKLRCDAV